MLTAILAADTAVREWLVQFHTAWLDYAMWTLSAIGSTGAVWACIALIMAMRSPRLRPPAWQVLLALLVAQLVVDWAIKPLVARPRPFVAVPASRVVGTYRPPTFAFPSGHAALSFAAATVLAFAVPRRRAIWFTLAALIAVSRVYIGVHYPLDVLCGATIGVGVGVLVSGGRAWYSRGSLAAPTGSQET
jgi:undecaprenyl-diphosphatase